MVSTADAATPDALGIIALEVVYEPDTPGSDEKSESSVKFRAWFDYVYVMMGVISAWWIGSILFLALFVTYVKPSNVNKSLAITSLVGAIASILGSSLLIFSGFMHYVRGKVRFTTLS